MPVLLLLPLLLQTAPPLPNGGFETLDEQGNPAGWMAPGGFQVGTVETGEAHSGQHFARLTGDGTQVCWRQELDPAPDGRWVGVGWFRAKDVKLAEGDFLRFYFHILYRDRPYAEATQRYLDLPSGTYDWRRYAVSLAPASAYPVKAIWVTVAAKMSSGQIDFDDLSLEPHPGHGGFLASDYARVDEAVMLTDLAAGQPAEVLTDSAAHGRWKKLPYEAGPFRGNLLWASPDSGAPELTIPLKANGWYAIFAGLTDPASLGCLARLRLDNRPAPVQHARTAGNLEEVFVTAADLTGRSLKLAQRHEPGQGCGLAYLKLIPLTAAEIATAQAPRPRTAVATIDGFSFLYGRQVIDRQGLQEEVEPYRESDFGLLLLQYGGALMTNYPSDVGEFGGRQLGAYPREGDLRYAENLQALAKQGINPTKVMIEAAHEVGLKVQVAQRPGAWEHSEPFSDFFTSEFYRQHPEWRTIDRDGTIVSRMSLAVPEVRARMIAVLREAVGFGADGASILFNRGAPFSLFEPAFSEPFQVANGVDPRTLPDDDPKLIQARCAVVTTFLREIRAMLDAEGADRGTKLELSAMVYADEADNRRLGLDLEGWSKDGLVSLVMPYRGAGGGKAKAVDLGWFKQVCAPQGVLVKPTLVAWQMHDPDAALKQVAEFWRDGADGLTIWDANSAVAHNGRWSVCSRLGHREELLSRADSGAPPSVTMRLHRLNGVVLDGPWGANWGY